MNRGQQLAKFSAALLCAVLLAVAPAAQASLISQRGAASALAFGFNGTVVAPVCDPNFSSVVALLHMDGTNGGSSFPDNSNLGLTYTPTSATTSTAIKEWGTASANFSSNNSTYPNASTNYIIGTYTGSQLEFGTGDFTVEFYVYFSSIGTGNQALVDVGGFSWAGAVGSYAVYLNGGALHFVAPGFTNYSFTWAPSATTWYAVAITRSGTNLRAFINGSQIGTTQTSSDNITSATKTMGISFASDFNGLTGYMDELRETKGVARYTTNYSVQTAPFPNC